MKIHWYDIKCDDDTVELRAAIVESRSKDSGEYMCLRLKLQANKDHIMGYLVREG